MKRTIVGLSLIACLALSSCSFEISSCPAYSNHNKMTKHGAKAQEKYAKRKI
jgi:hypothetical protein